MRLRLRWVELIVSRGMQDCFRLHPEIYASELDEEEVEEELREREEAQDGESVKSGKDTDITEEPKTSSRKPESDASDEKIPEPSKKTPAKEESGGNGD